MSIHFIKKLPVKTALTLLLICLLSPLVLAGTIYESNRYVEGFIFDGIKRIDGTDTIVITDPDLQKIFNKYIVLEMGLTSPEFTQDDTVGVSRIGGYYRVPDFSKHFYFYLDKADQALNLFQELEAYPYSKDMSIILEAASDNSPNEYTGGTGGSWWMGDTDDYYPDFVGAWDYTTGEEDGPVTMVVLDHPIEHDSNDDLYDGAANPVTRILTNHSADGWDGVEHGYNVASVIGALTDNGRGVGSANWHSRFSIKNVWDRVLNVDYLIAQSDIADKIYDAINIDPTKKYLFNMSWSAWKLNPMGYGYVSQALSDNYYAGGMAFASISNDHSTYNWPNCYANYGILMAISGIDDSGDHYGESDDWVTMAAPATHLKLLTRTSSDQYYTGNSFATPMVMGAASLLYTIEPGIYGDDIRYLLTSTATQLDDQTQVPDDRYGYGTLNIGEAVQKVAEHGVNHVYVNKTGAVDTDGSQWYRWDKDIYIPAYYGPNHEIWALDCASRGGFGQNGGYFEDFWKTFIIPDANDPMHYTLRTYWDSSDDIAWADVFGDDDKFYAYSIMSPQVWAGDIRRDVTWSGDVYLNDVYDVVVHPGATLTIAPGTNIHVTEREISILVKGSLIANGGTGDQKIEFFSEMDENYNAINNIGKDGIHIYFSRYANGTFEMENCVFHGSTRYSQCHQAAPYTPKWTISIEHNNASISNCEFRNNERSIRIHSQTNNLLSNVTVEDCNFLINNLTDISDETGVDPSQRWMVGPEATQAIDLFKVDDSVVISGNTFTGVASPIRCELADADILENQFYEGIISSCFEDGSTSDPAILMNESEGYIFRNHIEGFYNGIQLEEGSSTKIGANWIEGAMRAALRISGNSTPDLNGFNEGGVNHFEASTSRDDIPNATFAMQIIQNILPANNYGFNHYISNPGSNRITSIQIIPDEYYRPGADEFYQWCCQYWGYTANEMITMTNNNEINNQYQNGQLIHHGLIGYYTYPVGIGEGYVDDLISVLPVNPEGYEPPVGWLISPPAPDPCECAGERTTDQYTFVEAKDYIEQDDFNSAQTTLLSLLVGSEEQDLRIASLNVLTSLVASGDVQKNNLSTMIQGVADTTKIQHLKSECYLNMARQSISNQQYQAAVTEFESIINDPLSPDYQIASAEKGIASVYMAAASVMGWDNDDDDYSERLGNLPVYGNRSDLKPSNLDYYNKIKEDINRKTFRNNIDDLDITSEGTIPAGTYYINGEITVADTATLIINPGAELIFTSAASKLVVEGELQAIGTENEPIVFRSVDGMPADWSGLEFDGSSSCELEWVEVSDAVNNISIYNEAEIALQNVTSTNASLRGIYVDSSNDTDIDDVFITDCAYAGIETYKINTIYMDELNVSSCGIGLIAAQSNLTITNSAFNDNLSSGAEITDSYSGDISTSQFLGNGSYGLYLYNSEPILKRNIFRENFENGIRLVSSSDVTLGQYGQSLGNTFYDNGDDNGVADERAELCIINSRPEFFTCHNDFIDTSDPFLIYDATFNGNYYSGKENYFLNDGQIPVDQWFYPFGSVKEQSTWDVEPNNPKDVQNTDVVTSEARNFDLAMIAETNQDYESASDIYLMSAEENHIVAALDGWVRCQRYLGTDNSLIFSKLDSYLDNDILGVTAFWGKVRLLNELSEFEATIGLLDNHISTADSPVDSVLGLLGQLETYYQSYLANMDAGEENFDYEKQSINSIRKLGNGVSYHNYSSEEDGKIDQSDLNEKPRNLSGKLKIQKLGLFDFPIPKSIADYTAKRNQLQKKLRDYIASDVEQTIVPEKFALMNAYPNPFNPTVTIPFALPKIANVKISVYNILGQRVVELLDRRIEAGYHNVIWNSRSSSGLPVSSGVYFVTMEAPDYFMTQKIVLMK